MKSADETIEMLKQFKASGWSTVTFVHQNVQSAPSMIKNGNVTARSPTSYSKEEAACSTEKLEQSYLETEIPSSISIVSYSKEAASNTQTSQQAKAGSSVSEQNNDGKLSVERSVSVNEHEIGTSVSKSNRDGESKQISDTEDVIFRPPADLKVYEKEVSK